jgi:hypothetical protein
VKLQENGHLARLSFFLFLAVSIGLVAGKLPMEKQQIVVPSLKAEVMTENPSSLGLTSRGIRMAIRNGSGSPDA